MITSLGRGATRPVPSDPVNAANRHRRRGLTAVRYSLWLALAVAGWYLFAPVQLGGFDSYVLTDGTSMLPTIHGGGLVITREQPSYQVGDVVAYHNAALGGAVILHRIVRIDDGRYTFKGDNNAQPDLYPPAKGALVGRKWIYWAGGGTLMDNLKTPWIGGPLLGLLGMWAFADIGRRKDDPDGGAPAEDAADENEGGIVLRPIAATPTMQVRMVGAGPLS